VKSEMTAVPEQRAPPSPGSGTCSKATRMRELTLIRSLYREIRGVRVADDGERLTVAAAPATTR
jgi:hypothetical protein